MSLPVFFSFAHMLVSNSLLLVPECCKWWMICLTQYLDLYHWCYQGVQELIDVIDGWFQFNENLLWFFSVWSHYNAVIFCLFPHHTSVDVLCHVSSHISFLYSCSVTFYLLKFIFDNPFAWCCNLFNWLPMTLTSTVLQR